MLIPCIGYVYIGNLGTPGLVHPGFPYLSLGNGSSLRTARAPLEPEGGSDCILQGLLGPPAAWAPLPELAAG